MADFLKINDSECVRLSDIKVVRTHENNISMYVGDIWIYLTLKGDADLDGTIYMLETAKTLDDFFLVTWDQIADAIDFKIARELLDTLDDTDSET